MHQNVPFSDKKHPPLSDCSKMVEMIVCYSNGYDYQVTNSRRRQCNDL